MLLNQAFNYGLPPWLEIQFFYNRLVLNTKMIIDAAVGGVLMSKNLEEARELLVDSSNYYHWQSKRGATKKITRVHELDALTVIQAQLAAITKRLSTTTVSAIQTYNSSGGSHKNTSCEVSNNYFLAK